MGEDQQKKKGLSTLEKSLILLFVILTGACIGLVTIYFLEKNDNSQSDSSDNEVNSGCGGPQKLTGASGEFTSWRYPGSYDNGQSCTWTITVDPGKVIHLWFQDFSLEESDLCTADFITLKDNLGTIGKLCGSSIPKPVVSLENNLMVYFDTNDKTTDKGFKALYKAVAPEDTSEIVGGGGFLQGDQGDLLTPGFPASYENGALYQWRITVPDGEKVRLTFTSFDLIPEACADFVDVYDGHLTGSATLGRFCGGTLPDALVSSGNTMVVRFKSDAHQVSRGFSATYTKASLPPVVVPTVTPTPQPPTPAPFESGCGGPAELHGRKGEVHSLGFPQPYPGGLHCAWNITAPEGFLVQLVVTDMAVSGEIGQCKEDKLTVSDDLQTLGTHCGYILPTVVIGASNKMSLDFQSDSRLSDRGFSAKWEAVYPEDIATIQGCGGSSLEENGVIKSQDWPMNYKAFSECLWTVEVPRGKRITLVFTDFDLEAWDIMTFSCLDNVVVYDIADWRTTKHGPWCGTQLPKTIRTIGNKLVMRFHSDLFMEGKGFRAYWTTDATQPGPTEPPVPANPWDDITVDWPTTTCGRPEVPPTVHTRIVNGEPATPHSWPWQVSMQVWPPSRPDPSFSHICGGTLIHKNWVMTAAHCFINYADELHRWRMCLGKHNLTLEEPSERCFGVTAFHRHEGFKYPTVPTVEFDIALVRLDGEVTPSREVSYACLPSLEEVLPAAKKCYASGWGDETGIPSQAKVSEGLNQVALPVVPFDTCKRADYWWFQVKTSMICCGYTLPDELKSVCQGDSGGPLVCQDTANSPWEVHGITSFGPIGCIMDKKPSVFTRSSAYIPWMENVIRKDMYDLHTSGCGGAKDVTGTSGSISSMGFPDGYSNSALCQWNIRVPAGHLVHLRFHNFSLEESQLCMNDKVTLTDPLGSLGTHCSHTPPQDLVSDGDRLSVVFTSNNRVVDTGFSASWEALDPRETPVPCGGTFSAEQGLLSSPGWPNDYPAQAVCTWRITLPADKSIHITFNQFEVQAMNILGQCLDYVDIFDFAMKLQGRYCGFSLPPTVTVTGGTAVIRFLSNSANQQMGFQGYWTTDPVVFPTLPPSPPNPWDPITITWPEDCGNPAVKPSEATVRVVNGVEAVPYSWPWQVSMQASLPIPDFPNMHGCGGSLIHEEWVLTAAHCFMFPLNSPMMWRMCLGKHHMNSSMDVPSKEVCHRVDGIIRHEGFVYEQDRTDITNDIALVHLTTAVNMTREISPVCLPAAGAVMPGGTSCFVTGWGDEKGAFPPKVSEKLNQAALPIIDFATCSKPAYWWDTLRPSMVCAGYESPDELKSACQGDSGGPFACKTASAWEVHGIVSFGAQGCIVDKKPSVFTRVSAFNDWIHDNMKRFIYEKSL